MFENFNRYFLRQDQTIFQFYQHGLYLMSQILTVTLQDGHSLSLYVVTISFLPEKTENQCQPFSQNCRYFTARHNIKVWCSKHEALWLSYSSSSLTRFYTHNTLSLTPHTFSNIQKYLFNLLRILFVFAARETFPLFTKLHLSW
jgi:hypothetical protein